MKKILWVFVAIVFCCSLLNGMAAYAEDASDSSTVNWQEQLAADAQKLKEQRQKMKTDAQTAKTEEKDLKQQIRDATAAGDTQKAAELKAQLKTTHHENVQQKKQDKKNLRSTKKQLYQDRKAARRAGR
ncbi:MAG: hypothetical protein WC530_08345 [Candidatus Omnitrophota bacterium]|jgi:ribosome-binding ATPase YchF (GTP1/OBG family)